MKKRWTIVGTLLLVLIASGVFYRSRLSPQDQLLEGIRRFDTAMIQSAMNRGADATLVLERGNRINTTPGYTPLQVYLQMSSGFGHSDAVKAMLAKADLKVQSITGLYFTLGEGVQDGLDATPLHYAVHLAHGKDQRDKQRGALIQLLLDHGAPINAKAKSPAGVTPLMLAEDDWLIRLLVEAGADPNLVTARGACLMNFTGKEPSNSTWKFLKKHGGRPRRVSDSSRFPRPIWSSKAPVITDWKYRGE